MAYLKGLNRFILLFTVQWSQSGQSCFDGIDNDFDHTVDIKDRMCLKKLYAK